MSWLDFFRSKKEEKPIKKIRFQELGSELEIEIERIKDRIQGIGKRIRQRAMQLDSEFGQEIEALKKIDLRERREHEKVKFIVTENLKTYISHLQDLMGNLRNLDSNDRDYFERIHVLFENFKRNSVNSFQKATILIGKELEDVLNSIKKFSADVEGIVAEDKDVFEMEKIAIMLKNLLISLEEEKRAETEIKNFLRDSEKNLSELEKRKKELEKNIEDAKNSGDYSKFLDDMERGRQEREKMQKEIFSLKQEIDIKSMLKHFHYDEKKSRILKEYAEDFNAALENDENLKIISIVNEAMPDANLERLKELRLRGIELKNRQETAIEKKIREAEEAVKRSDIGLSSIHKRIDEERKREERLEKKIAETKEEIKKQAKSLWKNAEIIE